MTIRERTGTRLHRLLLRWGLLEHPWGRRYVKRHITLLGGYKNHPEYSDMEEYDG